MIAGSNGYVKYTGYIPSGYTAPYYAGDAAINAPLDCNGRDAYLGMWMYVLARSVIQAKLRQASSFSTTTVRSTFSGVLQLVQLKLSTRWHTLLQRQPSQDYAVFSTLTC